MALATATSMAVQGLAEFLRHRLAAFPDDSPEKVSYTHLPPPTKKKVFSYGGRRISKKKKEGHIVERPSRAEDIKSASEITPT